MKLNDKFSDFIHRINGFNTPIFGLLWKTDDLQIDKSKVVTSKMSKILLKYKQIEFLDRSPAMISLTSSLSNFYKLSASIELKNADNAKWRVGFRFNKVSSPKREFIFHVYQDPGSNAFHSRIVKIGDGKEFNPDVKKNHIGVINTNKFNLTIKKDSKDLFFYVDNIFLGKYQVPLDRINDLLISAWSHGSIVPINVTFSNVRICRAESYNDDKVKTTRKSTRRPSPWYKDPWLVVPAVAIILGAIISAPWWNSIIEKTKETPRVINSFTPTPAPLSSGSLRALQPIETGKKIGELPSGVYFFSNPTAIQFELENSKSDFLNVSSQDSKYNFELQKRDSRYFLIGFISDEAQSKIGTISKEPIFTPLFPNTWGGTTNAVAIPFDAIYTLKSREINFDSVKSVTVLDVGFKEVIESPELHKTVEL